MLLKNKVVIISGVGNRFGASTAHLFALEGAKVILISKNQEIMDKIAQDIKNKGGETLSMVCDVTNSDDVKKTFEVIASKFGEVDILFNNAGGNYTKREPMSEMEEDFFDEVIKNNLKSIFVMSKEAINHMKKNRGGSIINVSCAYKTLMDGNTAYAIAKTGVVGLTKNLARELIDHNIRVNCVSPGVVRNNYNIKNLETPLKTLKRKGNPEDIAYAVLYFASDVSSWITGQSLVIDGGEELFLDMEKIE